MKMHATENQKKWFDKKYKEGYSREEMLAAYRDRVALCKTIKRKPKVKEIVITLHCPSDNPVWVAIPEIVVLGK